MAKVGNSNENANNPIKNAEAQGVNANVNNKNVQQQPKQGMPIKSQIQSQTGNQTGIINAISLQIKGMLNVLLQLKDVIIKHSTIASTSNKLNEKNNQILNTNFIAITKKINDINKSLNSIATNTNISNSSINKFSSSINTFINSLNKTTNVNQIDKLNTVIDKLSNINTSLNKISSTSSATSISTSSTSIENATNAIEYNIKIDTTNIDNSFQGFLDKLSTIIPSEYKDTTTDVTSKIIEEEKSIPNTYIAKTLTEINKHLITLNEQIQPLKDPIDNLHKITHDFKENTDKQLKKQDKQIYNEETSSSRQNEILTALNESTKLSYAQTEKLASVEKFLDEQNPQSKLDNAINNIKTAYTEKKQLGSLSDSSNINNNGLSWLDSFLSKKLQAVENIATGGGFIWGAKKLANMSKISKNKNVIDEAKESQSQEQAHTSANQTNNQIQNNSKSNIINDVSTGLSQNNNLSISDIANDISTALPQANDKESQLPLIEQDTINEKNSEDNKNMMKQDKINPSNKEINKRIPNIQNIIDSLNATMSAILMRNTQIEQYLNSQDVKYTQNNIENIKHKDKLLTILEMQLIKLSMLAAIAQDNTKQKEKDLNERAKTEINEALNETNGNLAPEEKKETLIHVDVHDEKPKKEKNEFSWLTLLITGVGLLFLGKSGLLEKLWEKFKEFLGPLGNMLLDILGTAWKTIRENFPVIDKIGDFIDSISKPIVKVFDWIIDNWAVITAITGVLTGIMVFLPIITTLMPLLSGLLPFIGVVAAAGIGWWIGRKLADLIGMDEIADDIYGNTVANKSNEEYSEKMKKSAERKEKERQEREKSWNDNVKSIQERKEKGETLSIAEESILESNNSEIPLSVDQRGQAMVEKMKANKGTYTTKDVDLTKEYIEISLGQAKNEQTSQQTEIDSALEETKDFDFDETKILSDKTFLQLLKSDKLSDTLKASDMITKEYNRLGDVARDCWTSWGTNNVLVEQNKVGIVKMALSKKIGILKRRDALKKSQEELEELKKDAKQYVVEATKNEEKAAQANINANVPPPTVAVEKMNSAEDTNNKSKEELENIKTGLAESTKDKSDKKIVDPNGKFEETDLKSVNKKLEDKGLNIDVISIIDNIMGGKKTKYVNISALSKEAQDAFYKSFDVTNPYVEKAFRDYVNNSLKLNEKNYGIGENFNLASYKYYRDLFAQHFLRNFYDKKLVTFAKKDGSYTTTPVNEYLERAVKIGAIRLRSDDVKQERMNEEQPKININKETKPLDETLTADAKLVYNDMQNNQYEKSTAEYNKAMDNYNKTKTTATISNNEHLNDAYKSYLAYMEKDESLGGTASSRLEEAKALWKEQYDNDVVLAGGEKGAISMTRDEFFQKYYEKPVKPALPQKYELSEEELSEAVIYNANNSASPKDTLNNTFNGQENIDFATKQASDFAADEKSAMNYEKFFDNFSDDASLNKLLYQTFMSYVITESNKVGKSTAERNWMKLFGEKTIALDEKQTIPIADFINKYVKENPKSLYAQMSLNQAIEESKTTGQSIENMNENYNKIQDATGQSRNPDIGDFQKSTGESNQSVTQTITAAQTAKTNEIFAQHEKEIEINKQQAKIAGAIYSNTMMTNSVFNPKSPNNIVNAISESKVKPIYIYMPTKADGIKTALQES